MNRRDFLDLAACALEPLAQIAGVIDDEVPEYTAGTPGRHEVFIFEACEAGDEGAFMDIILPRTWWFLDVPKSYIRYYRCRNEDGEILEAWGQGGYWRMKEDEQRSK